ncbi:MAG: OprO/OprP family phosphate-selective porin [Holophagaceae bacterium]|nr:OprO/OprP family phosphate-selective porin [Holophagaceae bacterium]
MLNMRNVAITSLLLVAGLPAVAQTPKITGLAQVWYTQMMDNNLRLNSTRQPSSSIFNSRFNENGFTVRRTEIKAAGSVGDDIDWEVMFDPSISGDPVLQDVFIKYKLPNKIEFRVGQFKRMTTWEGMQSSSDLQMIERSMLARQFGDVRDRGAVASMGFGDSKGFNGRANLGVFQGDAGKNLDSNPQKDVVVRLDMNYGSNHQFGLYTLQGVSNSADKGALSAGTFAGTGNFPTDKQMIDNFDKTDQLGAFYRFQTKKIHTSVELITGTLGRVLPTVGSPAPSISFHKTHLDQKFLGYVGTFGYTFGRHSFVGRYDYLNYNSGDDWYTTSNPYIVTENGAISDYTPEYNEITVGYTYAFNPDRIRAANIKVNYVNRTSANFLRPRAGQTGEQGGDTLYLCFQVSF